MPRRRRHVPEPMLFELTCQTLQNYYLLQTSPQIRNIILGVLARAQRLARVTIHDFVFMMTHYHILATFENEAQMEKFANFLNSKLATKINRALGRRGIFWDSRYAAIPITNEEAAQAARLRYLLSHGVKEGLVARPQDWPGVNTLAHRLKGQDSIPARWEDLHGFNQAKRHRENPRRIDYLEEEQVELSPLPCWAHLSRRQCRQQIHAMVQDMTEEAREEHHRNGTEPVGVKNLRQFTPDRCVANPKRSPAPLVHAATLAARLAFRELYGAFVSLYEEASRLFREGDLTAVFPPGAFPPRPPTSDQQTSLA